MKKIIACCFLLGLLTYLDAQEYISVPLDNSAYDIIEMGVMRGIITAPPSAKPWSVNVVKKKLWEMMDDPEEVLSSNEAEMLEHAYESFERKKEGLNFLFSWESNFAVQSPDASISSVNLAKFNIRGDVTESVSWDITVQGEFLYIERDESGVPSMFPYTMSKMWDGGVLSLRNPLDYFAWPEEPSLAAWLQEEMSGLLFDRQLQFRLGRVRRDWGSGTGGSSLFMNAQASPIFAIDGVVSPFPWLDICFLTGVTEFYQNENHSAEDDSLFLNLLSAVQFEFNPLRFIYFSIGGSALWLHQVNLAAFANLELRMPGLLKIWGSIFLDRLDSSLDDFSVTNGNSYAYQAGIKTLVRWLPFGVFTFRYTKVEPYCYTNSYDGYSGRRHPSMSAFVSKGESLGYYMPPNSDELLFRLEAMFLPDLKAHIQLQILRHGVDYGYGAVPGSSLKDKLSNSRSQKHFLEDGVYRWVNVIKLGGSFRFMIGTIPLSVYAETGFVLKSFTINGAAGAGNAAEYDRFDDSVYRSGNDFIFSVGFRLFPR